MNPKKPDKVQAAEDIIAWLECQSANASSPDGKKELLRAIAGIDEMRRVWQREDDFFASRAES